MALANDVFTFCVLVYQVFMNSGNIAVDTILKTVTEGTFIPHFPANNSDIFVFCAFLFKGRDFWMARESSLPPHTKHGLSFGECLYFAIIIYKAILTLPE